MVDPQLCADSIKAQQDINAAHQRAVNFALEQIQDLRAEFMAINQIMHHLIAATPEPAAIFEQIDSSLRLLETVMDAEDLALLREKLEGYRPTEGDTR